MLSNEAKTIDTLFNIQSKTGARVPFKINKAQEFLDINDVPDQHGKTRIIIAKARQKGFSSFILAKFGVRCMGVEGTRAVVVSHESTATQRLLDKVDYFMKHMNGPSPVFGRHSRTELYFPKRESTYYIGTAGAKAFGRGDTVTDLHCSEYAFWENPVIHFAGLFQAVPWNGRIYIESTGNGRNNDFYYMWEHAEGMGYKRLFYPWFADQEYSLTLPLNMLEWKPDIPRYNEYLLSIKNKFKLSDQQMYWYEMKLKEIREDISSMQQEYPSEPDECFQATGGAIFNNVTLNVKPEWVTYNHDGYYTNKLLSHPRKGYHYVIGADPSGGTGNDDAAFQIFCCETFEQVFEFFNNRANPISLGELLCSIGTEYNDAFISTESNNHGAAVIPYLKTNYKLDKIYKRKYGTKTTSPLYGWQNSDVTKHALVGMMQEMLDDVIIYGVQTVKELKGFEEDKEGKMNGKSDNLVIATGLAFLGLKKFESFRKEYLKPIVQVVREKPNYMTYSLDAILKDISKRKNSIKTQTGVGYPNIN